MTQEEILSEMNSMQSNSPELSALTSTSATSFVEQLKRLFALMAAKLFVLLSAQQKAVSDIYTKNKYGTEAWYRMKVLEFQLGYNLEVIDGELKYAVVDESLRIVKNVKFVTSSFNEMLVVVSGKQYDPVTKHKINDAFVASIQEYMDEIKLLSANVRVASYVSDRVFLRVGIKVNPLLLNANGSRLTSASTFPVQDFLSNLITTYDGSVTPISKYYIQQRLMTMPEVKFADVSQMFGFRFDENSTIGAGDEFIESVSGLYYLDPNSSIAYV
jgi:hypothetical protein